MHLSCGKCPACRRSRQLQWQSRLDHHQRTSAATLFITLTYSNEHLPLVTYDNDSYDIFMVTHSTFDTHGNIVYKIITSDYEKKYPLFKSMLCGEKCYDIFIPHWVQSRHSNGVTIDNGHNFAICLRKDVQDFIKRLRTKLFRYGFPSDVDYSFDYFICSEYGPKTFRPHYHGLLFFRDRNVASLCHSHFINDAWAKSNLGPTELEKQCQFVESGTSCSSYVSKYVVCDSDLPPILRSKPFAPFHISSKSNPIGCNAIPLADISTKVRETDLLYDSVYRDKDTNEYIVQRIHYPSSLWQRYFPQFLFARTISPSTLYKLYSRIFELSPDDLIPNLVKEFNDRFGIGECRKSISRSIISSYPRQDTNLLKEVFGLFYGNHDVYFNSYDVHKVTYSSVKKRIFTITDDYDESTAIDYFLFGIPQNRCVVNKLLKLRKALMNINDNWCINVDTYLQYYYQYHSKVFSNQLLNFYENYNYYCDKDSIESIQEYYPTFINQLPQSLYAIDPKIYEKVESILYYRFNLSIFDFYIITADDLTLRNDNYDYHDRYILYRTKVRNSHRSFYTKRLYYHDKYLSG